MHKFLEALGVAYVLTFLLIIAGIVYCACNANSIEVDFDGE